MNESKRWYERAPNGHVWKTEGGRLDIFALDSGNHNGPECVNCGYSFCHHCRYNRPLPRCKPAKKKKAKK